MAVDPVMSEEQKLYEQGLAAEKSGDLHQALMHYQAASVKNPSFRPVFNNMGAVYSRLGKHELAIKFFNRTLELKEDEIVHFNLGSEHYRLDNYGSSEKHLIAALKISRRFIKAHILLAYLYRELKDLKKSSIYFQNALKIEPDNRLATLGFGVSLAEQNKTEHALEVAEAYLAHRPDDMGIKNLRAGLLLKLNRFQESLQELDQLTATASGYKSFTDHLDSAREESEQEYSRMFSGIEDKIRDKTEKLKQKLQKRKEDKKTSNQSESTKSQDDELTENLKEMVDLSFLHLFNGDTKKALRFLMQAKKMKEEE